MLGSIWLYRIWIYILELLAIFGQFSPFHAYQKSLQIQKIKGAIQNSKLPLKWCPVMKNEYVNRIQKVLQQNFVGYEDLWNFNRPHFGVFYR